MTLINKIREKSGVAVTVIALAMGMFVVGGDLLSSNSFLLGNEQIVGEINGREIKLQEYNAELEYVKNNYRNSTGQLPAEAQMPGLRTQAWNNLISKYAYEPQYDELGIEVTEAELREMVQGTNLHPGIENSFKNPETGEVDRERLKSYLQTLNEMGPNSPQFREFVNFEQRISEERKKSKYEDLLANTYYATSLEGKQQYEMQNTKADVKVLYVPFSSIPDTEVEANDAELKAYFEKNKKDFEKPTNREIEYVRFEVKATAEDRTALSKELEAMKTTFASTSNDSAFVDANTDATNSFLNVGPNGVPSRINVDEVEKGKVFGPFQEGQSFKLYKIMDVKEDTMSYAKASHILFKSDENKTEARNKANEVLREIKNGADFAAKAREHGSDGTKNRGGDLGWFDQNTMVKPFSEAVFNASSTGLLPRLVETEFGYHIVKVDQTKRSEKYVIGVIEKEITPSDATIDAAYRKAGRFSKNNTGAMFDAAVQADSTLVSLQALTIAPDARFINNMNSPRVRSIVRWAYSDETEIGDVSEIFDLDDQFIIAKLRGKSEKGIASFEAVKEDVRKEVLKEKKAEKIIAKLKESSGTLEDRQQAYGASATVNEQNDLSMNSTSINRVGFAPTLIGTIFTMEQGQTSEPVKEQNGVAVVEIVEMEKALETADYSIYQDQVANKRNSAISYKISQAMEKFADVENSLYKYF